MRIERIVLRNYRQFKDVELTFDKRTEHDLHVLIGKNGSGKTNLLNAINWCMYHDEPHRSQQTQRLPVVNVKSIEEASDGDFLTVHCEIWANLAENKNIVVTREDVYRVNKDVTQPTLQRTNFDVKEFNESGEAEVHEGEEAQAIVDRIVPKRIRDFFFFDGERLDNYFREVAGQNIRHAIFDICQIDLLDRIEDRMDKVLREITREAGRCSPAIEVARKDDEEAKDKLKEVDQQIENCTSQIAKAKERIEECVNGLRGSPDTERLEAKRGSLKMKHKEKMSLRDRKLEEKQGLLFEYGKFMPLLPILGECLRAIEEKRANKQVPPSVDRGLLEDILKAGSCTVCGRALDSRAEEQVGDLLRHIEFSSAVVQHLLRMESPLRSFQERAVRFRDEIEKVTRETDGYEADLADVQASIAAIDKELSGYNADKLRSLHEERRTFEQTHDASQRMLGVLQERRTRLLNEVQETKNRLQAELDKEQRATTLRRQIRFASTALEIVKDTKQRIMGETRGKIEEQTKQLFLGLALKKRTFADVRIDEDYSISVLHTLGYECLDSMSAAERELLALAFTLALHKVSGFDSPVLIDTPVARVADEHRANFGKTLLDVSVNKQIILLFTSAEYSDDLSRVLDAPSSTRFFLELSADEKETRLEVR